MMRPAPRSVPGTVSFSIIYFLKLVIYLSREKTKRRTNTIRVDLCCHRYSTKNPSITTMMEWRKCPRCKNNVLKPELLHTEPNGYTQFWWVCENSDVCNFPLDMPPLIYHVSQSPQQKIQKCIPLPNILNLPGRYHHLYPLTFGHSRPPSRCSSVVSSPTNCNETTIDSDGTLSEKSSGQNRLKADSVSSGIVNTPSTSAQSSEAPEQETDNIDDDIDEAATKSKSCRTIKRRRPHDPRRSWAALIEKVADSAIADSIITMEDGELFLRMKEFFDAQYFQRTPMCYKRSSPRVTYRLEDVENCLRTVTSDDWKSARKRMPHLSLDEQQQLKTSNATELLKSVGIDLKEKRRAVEEKVGKIMRGFSVENEAKRRKIEEDRKQVQKKKEESRQTSIHQSVSARLLNRKLKRDEEERSLASTPASLFDDIPQFDEFPQELPPIQLEHREPVHFHLGNPEENVERNAENDEEWGFNFDELYANIHAQNSEIQLDPHDSVEAILSQLDAPPSEHHELLDQPHEHSGDEDDSNRQRDDEDFTGFGDNDDFGLGSSNLDFVNDNFGF
uniref:CW-type domain-containing protein n=2 Tax=Caenorhabditis tropicalis TaxID=1561998 RepID=A0A1I7UUY3_9PELO